MKRPLLFGCIWLMVCVCVWTYYSDAPPFYKDISILKEGHILLTGQICQKEYSSYYGTNQTNLYLQSIQIIDQDTGQVSEFNPSYKIICELKNISTDPELGRKIQVTGQWKFMEQASNPGQFDAAEYYYSRKIMGRLKEGSIRAMGSSYWHIREWLSDLRVFLKKRIYTALPNKEASIVAKMLLGEKSGLDQEIRDLYQRNGIVHILSISGLHITIMGMGLYRFLRKCTCPVIPAAFAGTIFLFLYGAMTGFGISSVRAIGMYGIHMLGILSGRTYDQLTATGVMMAGMLCFDRGLIENSGFWLSFGSVAGIGLLTPVMQSAPLRVKRPGIGGERIRFFLKKYCSGLLQSLWLSTSISIFTLPITLYFFYEVPIYSAFVNLMVLPFMGFVMGAGIVLMIFPNLALVSWVEQSILSGYERVCLFMDGVPGHTWIAGRPEWWQIGVYYAGLLGIIWLYQRKAKKGSRFLGRKGWLLGIPILVFLLGMDVSSKDSVHFLAVGQGDCIVVMTKTGKTYLFDGGSSSQRNVGEDIILPFLKYHGISVVDGVFISHPDMDHISGILELLDQDIIEVKALYLPNIEAEDGQDFETILKAVTTQMVRYYSAGEFMGEGNLQITCLHPEDDFEGENNEYSGCFLLENQNLRVLLTGDVEGEGENCLILQLKKRGIHHVQVLKAAHHGSGNTTSEEFLKTLQADLAVISCGKNNLYGHPHEDMLKRLEEAGIRQCITWEVGCVSVTEDGYKFYKR